MNVYRLTQNLVLWATSTIGVGDYAVYEPSSPEPSVTSKAKPSFLVLVYTAFWMASGREAFANILWEPCGDNRLW